MPAVNGHVVSSPALHASSSISSLAPATMTFGAWASMARAGSFCLFCENGPEGLPLLTRVSPPAANAVADASAITTPTTRTEKTGPRPRICSPFCYRSAIQQMLGLYPFTARPALGVRTQDTADSWVARRGQRNPRKEEPWQREHQRGHPQRSQEPRRPRLATTSVR